MSALRRSAVVSTQDTRVALLERLIDHAPLFPPASLALPEALEEDRRARESPSAFVLGRFVCPASRLAELPDVGRGVSAVLDGDVPGDVRVEALEVQLGAELSAIGTRPAEVYVEVQVDDDLEKRLDEVARRGYRAKVRCGGAPLPASRSSRGSSARAASAASFSRRRQGSTMRSRTTASTAS